MARQLSRLTSLLLSCALCITFGTGTAFAQKRGPSGCPPGVSPKEFVCYTLVEDAKTTGKILNLEEALNNLKFDLARARARRLKRAGWNLGPGVGVGFDGEVQGGIYATFAWRFR